MFERALAFVNGREEQLKNDFAINIEAYVKVLDEALDVINELNTTSNSTFKDLLMQYNSINTQVKNINDTNRQKMFLEVRDLKGKLFPIINTALEKARYNYNVAETHGMQNPVIANTAASLKNKDDMRYTPTVTAAEKLIQNNKRNSLSGNQNSLLSPRTINDIKEIASTFSQFLNIKDLKSQIEIKMLGMEHNLITLKQHQNSTLSEAEIKKLSTEKNSQGIAAKVILNIMRSKDFKIPATHERNINRLQLMVTKFEKELKENKDSVLKDFLDANGMPAETLLHSIRINLNQIEETQIAAIQKVMHKNFLKRVEDPNAKLEVQEQNITKNKHINSLVDRAFEKAIAMDNYLKQKSPAVQRNATLSTIARRTTIFVYQMLTRSPSRISHTRNEAEKSPVMSKPSETAIETISLKASRQNSTSSLTVPNQREAEILKENLISGSRSPSISMSESEMKEEDLPNRPRRR